MTGAVPPRFVPTLTEVVRPTLAPSPPGHGVPAMAAAAVPAELQEQMVKRVLQRVDMMLDRRLREAVGRLILEHTETLAPRLREEIESAVRHSVGQAFEQELLPPTSHP